MTPFLIILAIAVAVAAFAIVRSSRQTRDAGRPQAVQSIAQGTGPAAQSTLPSQDAGRTEKRGGCC
jgi:hypothetical protein